MKCLARGLFHGLAALSLFLGAAAAALWVQSDRTPVYVNWNDANPRRDVVLWADRGVVSIVSDAVFDPMAHPPIQPVSKPPQVLFRCGTAVASFALLPAAWLALAARRRRKRLPRTERRSSAWWVIAGFWSAMAVALGLLWMHSYGSWDRLRYVNAHGLFWAQSLRGDVEFMWTPTSRPLFPFAFWTVERHDAAWLAKRDAVRPLDLFDRTKRLYPGVYVSTGSTHVFGLKLWLMYAAAAVLACGHLVWALRKSRRRRQGLCAMCGYDLRATPDRCPECGTITQSTKSRA